MPHQKVMRLTILLLVALIVQACSTTPPGGGGGLGGGELSLASVPGAAFQPPIGGAEVLTGQLDPGLDVSLAAFLLRDGTPEGSPVGNILSADNGGVTLYNDSAREYYEALWKPTEAGVGAGTVLRLEVRLPNAPADAPACVAEPDLLEGCIAYVDVQVRQDGVLIGQSGANALPVALQGGALPVRVHIQQGTLEMKRVLLGDQHVTVVFDSGASVEFPPVVSGAGTVVDVLLLGNGPLEELSLIEWASDTVALQFHSAVTWTDTAAVQVRLPLRSEALQTQDVWEIGNTVIVNVRRARSAAIGSAVGAAKDVASFGYRALSAGGQIVLDAYMWEIEALGDAIGAGIHTVTYTVPKSLKNWRDSFKPPVEGLFGVRTKYIPTISEAASNGCTFDLINAGLAFQHLPTPETPWNSTADTAVVMVHGWQTLGGILQGGDVLGKAAHCRTWIDLMAAYTHRGGEWSTLREGTDLFTFRYDSDHRIALSGTKLKEAVTQLQMRGYRNVILLGHSMGGLVSIEARQQLPDPKFVSGIVTLATPFMGGAPVCTATARQTIDGISKEYCAMLVVPTDENVAILLEYVDLGDGSVLDGTLDLASYYGSTIVTAEANPYLERLWSESSNFQDVTALYGDSSLPGRSADTFYAPLIAATRVLGGPNDGAVAIASAVAASSFTMNKSQALSLSQLSAATPAGFGRDHGQMTNGCRNCTDGRNGNPGAYDPYFNYVASAVASHLTPINTAPGALTLQPAEPYCTLEGSPAIRLTWSVSAGAEAYEIHRDGSLYATLETLSTTFENTANITPGQTYSYFVRARNSLGVTDSNTVSTTAMESCETLPPGTVNSNVIAAGYTHSLALRDDGTVWAWGWNDHGQLGDGTTTERFEPVQVVGLSGVTSIAAGWFHSLALRDDGTVWAWGGNEEGQLGDVTNTSRFEPVRVEGLTSVTSIAAGGDHSLALRDDGTLWAWGRNRGGELGVGATATGRNQPVQVVGISGVRSIAARGAHSVALRDDGTVWAWGRNGDGTTLSRYVPVQVVGLSGVTSIAAGDEHSLALRDDGTLWARGWNVLGELGDGTTTNRIEPVQVVGLSGVTSIAAGDAHSLALRDDGTVWAWGRNGDGQLGDGTTTNRYVPVQVVGLSGVTSIVAGYYHSFALRDDGTVWAWGWNANGQLGDGTTTDRFEPVQVVRLSGVATP